MKTDRRKFLGSIASTAATLGAAAMGSPFELQANPTKQNQEVSNLETWFNKLNGKHKMVFDAISANDGFQIVWAYTFMETSNQTGTPDNELSALVVLRNKAIAIAMEDRIWKKYKFGKFFGIIDRSTNASAEIGRASCRERVYSSV